MTNNIVFLVGSYYPNYSAVGRCQGNIADEMEKRGFNVTVISEKTSLNEVDFEMLGNQKIIRVINRLSYERLKAKNQKGVIGKIKSNILRIVNAIYKIVDNNSLRNSVVEEYYNALKKLDFIPDLIIPTCLPFETVVAATKYKLEFKACRVVPILYDMFAENAGLTLTDWNKNIKKSRNLSVERKAFELCDEILHMPSWSQHLMKYHEGILNKAKEIEHPLIKEPNICENSVFQDGINLAFIGIVDIDIRNPLPVLDFFLKNDFYGVKLHFYVTGNAVSAVERASDNCTSIVYHGKVDSFYARRVISDADFLISIGNKVSDMFPTEVLEYMSSGKPIIHFYQLDNDPVLDVLKKYPVALCLPIEDIHYENVISFINSNKNKRIDFAVVRDLFMNASYEMISAMFNEKIMEGGITLVFAGALNKGHVEPYAYLELIRKLPHKGLFRTKFYSSGNAVNDLNNHKDLNISCMKWVPHEELIKVLQETDILVSLAQIEGRQISSKIFEYMSYGKVIIHIYYTEDDINLRYLRKYPLSILIKADDIKIKNAEYLEELILKLSWLNMGFDLVKEEFLDMTPESICNTIVK